MLAVEPEILGRGAQGQHLDLQLLGFGQGRGLLHEDLVVDDARIAAADRHFGLHAVPGVDVRGDDLDAAVDDAALAFVERAQRSLHVDLVGHDVRRAPGLHAADREHALLTVERDEARQQFGAGRHGVFELLAHGAVPARAADAEAQFVACRHVLSGPESEGPDLQLRFDVFADDGPHVVALERLFGQHQRGSARVALLARLEQPEERAPEIGRLGEGFQHAEQHRGVHVVAAGVHHALVLRSPLAVVPLRDGQGVDVGAQHRGAPVAFGGLAALDAGHDARRCDPAVFDAQFVELLFDERRRVVFLERQFGVRMQAAAEFDRFH